MRFNRIFPARWPKTTWPESNSTRKTALGKLSMILPSSSIVCLLGSLLPKFLIYNLKYFSTDQKIVKKSADFLMKFASNFARILPNKDYFLTSSLIFCLNLGIVFCQEGAKAISTRSISGLDKIISLACCLVFPEMRLMISEVSMSEMASDS